MINHVRTLILNRDADYFSGVEGAEYIPPTFRPVELSADLTRIRSELIPSGLDAFSENYILGVIMRILHASDTETFVYELDSRITYTPGSTTVSELCDSPVDVEILADSASDVVPKYRMDYTEYPTALGVSGQHLWSVTPVDSYNFTVTYTRGPLRTYPIQNTKHPQRTSDVGLLGDYLKLYLELPSEKLTGSFRFNYSIDIAVPYSIANILTRFEQLMAQPHMASILFGNGDQYADTLAKLSSLWFKSNELTLRFAGITFAYAIQTELLRLKRGS
jgi:hypothetical protein